MGERVLKESGYVRFASSKKRRLPTDVATRRSSQRIIQGSNHERQAPRPKHLAAEYHVWIERKLE